MLYVHGILTLVLNLCIIYPIFQVGPDGNEDVSPKVLQSIDFPPMTNPGDYKLTPEEEMAQSQWNLKSAYEALPFVPQPFMAFPLTTGKDQIHCTFMDTLFSAGNPDSSLQ